MSWKGPPKGHLVPHSAMQRDTYSSIRFSELHEDRGGLHGRGIHHLSTVPCFAAFSTGHLQGCSPFPGCTQPPLSLPCTKAAPSPVYPIPLHLRICWLWPLRPMAKRIPHAGRALVRMNLSQKSWPEWRKERDFLTPMLPGVPRMGNRTAVSPGLMLRGSGRWQ